MPLLLGSERGIDLSFREISGGFSEDRHGMRRTRDQEGSGKSRMNRVWVNLGSANSLRGGD
jgi:hypothetical protein